MSWALMRRRVASYSYELGQSSLVKRAAESLYWTPRFVVRGASVLGDVGLEDVDRLKGYQLVLGEETERRDEADSMWLPADVAIGEGEGLEFTSATGGNHSKEEGEFDCEMQDRCLAEGLEGGPDRRHRIKGRSHTGIRHFSGGLLNEHPPEKMLDRFAVGD